MLVPVRKFQFHCACSGGLWSLFVALVLCFSWSCSRSLTSTRSLGGGSGEDSKISSEDSQSGTIPVEVSGVNFVGIDEIELSSHLSVKGGYGVLFTQILKKDSKSGTFSVPDRLAGDTIAQWNGVMDSLTGQPLGGNCKNSGDFLTQSCQLGPLVSTPLASVTFTSSTNSKSLYSQPPSILAVELVVSGFNRNFSIRGLGFLFGVNVSVAGADCAPVSLLSDSLLSCPVGASDDVFAVKVSNPNGSSVEYDRLPFK